MITLLMGLRGSGKSTLSRALGAALLRPVVDLDDRTAALLGTATPGEALRLHGLAAFRDAEVRALCDVMKDQPCILALGGGTPTAPGALSILTSLKRDNPARLLYLRASIETLRSRLAHDATERPSLTGLPMAEEIAKLHAARDPLYAALADRIVAVDGRTEPDVLAELVQIATTR
jgi:shikimate kinase